MIGLAIPTRGDRSIFLSRCLQMMNNQTLRADIIHVVSEEPKSEDKDITYRYRKAFEFLFAKGCEVVFLIEDDDFYHESYLEVMYNNWIAEGKPEVFGLDKTIYYHLTRKVYSEMKHPNRSSAFCTMVTEAVLEINFPKDSEPFLDLEIWKQLTGKVITVEPPICMGIKHGVGLSGGRGHLENFPYSKEDKDSEYLKLVTGSVFESYQNLVRQLK